MKFLSDAKELAEFFRGSVTYPLWDGTHTVADIQAHADELYALTERHAFAALLHDCVANNKLTEIFLAMFDCNIGVATFVDEASRANPVDQVLKFIGGKGKKYQKNISLVCVAFDAWLAFYGSTMTASRSECPFCGGKINGGKCGKCKRSVESDLVADGLLREVLTAERNGTPCENPEFWDDIADGSEFDVNYKRPVVEIRRKRLEVYRAEHAEEIAAKIAAGTAALDGMRERMTSEQPTSAADYDKYLAVLTDSAVRDALAVDEAAFAPVCNQFAEEVRVLSANASFAQAADSFCAAITALYNDYNRPSHTADSLKRYLDKAAKLYSEVCDGKYADAQGSSRFVSAKSRYEGGLSDNVTKEIERLRVIKNTAAAYNELCDAVEIMYEKLVGVTAEQGLYDSLFAEYNEKFAKNAKFNNLRAKRKEDYDALLEGVESSLEQLRKGEQELNDRKIADVVALVDKEATALLVKVKRQIKAHPTDTKAYDALYEEYNKLYRIVPESKVALDNSKEAVDKREEIRCQLDTLHTNIQKDAEAKKRNVKRAAKATAISAAVIVALCVVLFLVELGGALPVGILLSPITPGVSVSDFGDGSGTLVKIGEQAQVIVPDKQRAAWSFKELTVTSVANNAFSQKKNLQSIVFPESLQYFTEGFYQCSALKTMVLRSVNPVGLRDHPFSCTDPETGVGYDNGYNMSIYVPTEAYDDYLVADTWKTYSYCIFPDLYDYTNGVTGTLKDKESYCVVVLEGSGFEGEQRFIRVKKGEKASIPMQSSDGTDYEWAVADGRGNCVSYFDPEQPIENNIKLVSRGLSHA